MSLSTCCRLISCRRSWILSPSFVSVESSQSHGKTHNEICPNCTFFLYVSGCPCPSEPVCSSPTIWSPRQALSLHLLSRNGNCALYKSIFSPLLLPPIPETTHCMPDKPRYSSRHHLYLTAIIIVMILHYPTWYLYPPLEPARPPTAVG